MEEQWMQLSCSWIELRLVAECSKAHGKHHRMTLDCAELQRKCIQVLKLTVTCCKWPSFLFRCTNTHPRTLIQNIECHANRNFNTIKPRLYLCMEIFWHSPTHMHRYRTYRLAKSDNNCFTLLLPCMQFRPTQSSLRLEQICSNLISITTIVNILSAAQPGLCGQNRKQMPNGMSRLTV